MIKVSTIVALACALLAGKAAAQVTFYENDGFRGRAFSVDRAVGNFDRFGFNDRASSAVVRAGRWEVCTDAGFRGRCVTLRPGRYPSLNAMGLNDQLSSARQTNRGDRRGTTDRRDEYSSGGNTRTWRDSGPPPGWDPNVPYFSPQQ